MDAAVSCRSEACYPSGQKHRRSWSVKRREFIIILGGAAAAWPLAARAQQPAMPVIGLLTSGGAGDVPQLLAAFRQGLNNTGFVEGQNVAIEYRFAENRAERLPALAAELVQRQVRVISDPFDRCGFFIDTGCKRPHELAMDSSHHARRIRARARRLSAGAWDMRMH